MPNHGEMKSVTVRQSKAAFNLLMLITQSKILIQELETVKESTIFNIESVIIENPKNVTKECKNVNYESKESYESKNINSKKYDVQLNIA